MSGARLDTAEPDCARFTVTQDAYRTILDLLTELPILSHLAEVTVPAGGVRKTDYGALRY